MTETLFRNDRRRIMTVIAGHYHQAHACAELIDVLLRRDDLEHRDELCTAAEALRWLFANPVTQTTLRDVRTLIGTASTVVRIAGLARRVWLPTVAYEVERESRTPYANVLDAAAFFFAWLAREQEEREERLFRAELIGSAIELSRVAGQLAPTGAYLEQHELDRAAHSVLEAMRVAVAVMDPEAPASFRTWQEESRARLAEDVERRRLELALEAKRRADREVDEPDDVEPGDGVGDAIACDVVTARASNDDALN